MATKDIDKKLGTQKGVGKFTIEDILGGRPVSYDELRSKIIEVGSGKVNQVLAMFGHELGPVSIQESLKSGDS